MMNFVCRTNHKQDHIVDRTGLPGNLIQKVSGKIVFEEQDPRVCWFILVLLCVPLNSLRHVGTNHLQNHIVEGSAIPDHLSDTECVQTNSF